MGRSQLSTVIFIIFAFLGQSSPAAVGDTTTTAETTTTTAETTTTTAETTTTTTAETTTTTAETTTTTAAETTTTTAETTTTASGAGSASDNMVCSINCMGDFPINANCLCVCPEFQPDPTNEKKFIWLVNGQEISMSCAFGTVFAKSVCGCIENTKLSSPEVTCEPLLDYGLSIDGTTYTDAVRGTMGFMNKNGPITVVPAAGASSSGLAANFYDNGVSSDYFDGNDLTANAYFIIRFQPSISMSNVNQVILSNGCVNNNNNVQPSVMLAYNATSNQVSYTVRTNTADSGVCAAVVPDANGWFTVTISIANSVTTVSINGQSVCTVLQGSGHIATTQCALTIGADPMKAFNDFSMDFKGLIDYVRVTKHCSTPNAQ